MKNKANHILEGAFAMGEALPMPGLGYVIRELLGGGNWKSAYRASSSYRLADVALLYFHDESKRDIVAKDVTNLLRTVSKHRFSGYLAEFLGVQKGEDGRIFIVEELLDRPLHSIAPVHDILQFTRIARDLCRGLLCLHESKLIHRDLKLDNCGLSHQQLAKIFDLGSVTSDAGHVRGSVLTRAPELFILKNGSDEPQCDYATDVWALGATLFALRTGEYPFVYRREVDERNTINNEWKNGRISFDESQRRKERIDKGVADRILKGDAEEDLKKRVHASLRGRAEEILLSMLSFDRSRRRDIQTCEAAFSDLANELAGAGAVEKKPSPNKWDTIKNQLRAVERKEFVLTEKQIERIVAEYNRVKPEDSDKEIESTLKKIKEQLIEA
jgi:serine/threonine protein kinase